MDPREAHEYGWMVHVVSGEVIRIRVFSDQFLALVEIDAYDKRVWFGRLVDRHACQHLTMELERGRPVGCALFDVRKLQSDLPNRVERHPFARHGRGSVNLNP